MWLGYLVYSLVNCAMKLCIKTGLRDFRLSAYERGEEMGWPLGGLEWWAPIFSDKWVHVKKLGKKHFILAQASGAKHGDVRWVVKSWI